MIAPLRLSFVVACPRDVAFGLWTEASRVWWRSSHTSAGTPGSTILFEPFVSGRVYERTADGEEIPWARSVPGSPRDDWTYTWHLRADRADATDVEIRFLEEDGGRCRVEIEHRGWERLGEHGPERREANGHGWNGVLPHFVTACEGGSGERAAQETSQPPSTGNAAPVQ